MMTHNESHDVIYKDLPVSFPILSTPVPKNGVCTKSKDNYEQCNIFFTTISIMVIMN